MTTPTFKDFITSTDHNDFFTEAIGAELLDECGQEVTP